MPEQQTPKQFALAVINDAKNNISQLGTVRGEASLITSVTAQAHLAIAAALLDMGEAIRGDGTGASVERAMGRLTEALREGTGRRET
ncbi:hypothetical protein [Streptomyces sp. NRRL S-920]|uniref:hypothetical protein n=1 Tax=Streptomyces sp. NRRL S-920 TaxID=1463921 RepID=UPI0004C595E0|nr:hypothetical protein [Streptomyces sp. NRRL S-920]